MPDTIIPLPPTKGFSPDIYQKISVIIKRSALVQYVFTSQESLVPLLNSRIVKLSVSIFFCCNVYYVFYSNYVYGGENDVF